MLLWRIEPLLTRAPDLTALANGLSLHVRYAPLTTVLMQIGTQQQAYLSSPGCSGCHRGRCMPTCSMAMLRRMLIKSELTARLRPITPGLAPRPYTRLAVAIPRPKARPLEAQLLEPWQEARLWASWRTVWGRRIVGAALAVGADGPDPAEVLRSYGWLSGTISARIVSQPTSRVLELPFGWLWPDAPQLLVARRLTGGASVPGSEARQTIVTPPPAWPGLPADGTGVAQQEDEPIPILWNGQVVAFLTAALVASGVELLSAGSAEPQSRPVARPAPAQTVVTPAPAAPAQPTTTEQPYLSRIPTRRRRWVQPYEVSPGEGVGNITTPSEADTTPAPEPRDAESQETDAVPHQKHCPLTEDPATHERELTSGAALPHTWPEGAGFTTEALEDVMRSIVENPVFSTGRHFGLSPRIVARHVGIRLSDAQALLAWLERAALLESPRNPRHIWNHPRPLITLELTEIAARLHATTPPTSQDILDAFAVGT